MTYLVDTHLLLWSQSHPELLPRKAHELLGDERNEFLFSAASIWEIAIKAQLKRSNFFASPQKVADEALSMGYRELPITSIVAAHVSELPMHHGDPFDRLLVAQAMLAPARLLTVDRRLAPYTDLVTVV